MMRIFILLACAATSCVCEMVSIGDQAYPYISILDTALPVIWNEGSFGAGVGMSSAVRINSRGIRFISIHYSALVLGSHIGDCSDSGGILPGIYSQCSIASKISDPTTTVNGAWKSIPCELGRDSLCAIKFPSDVNGKSRIFPTFNNIAYTTQGTLPPEEGGFRNVLASECPESSTGRVVIPAADNNNNNMDSVPTVSKQSPFWWDISACNVFGVGMDFVYVPYDGTIFILSDPISFQVSITIGVLTMGMVVVLAHNLEFTLGSSRTPARTWFALGCMLALLFVSLFATGKSDILLPYVTLDDRLGCIFLVAYVVYYSIRIFVDRISSFSTIICFSKGQQRSAGDDDDDEKITGPAHRVDQHMSSPVNPVLATLLIVSMRLYSTLDNMYTPGILFIVCTRVLHKIHTLQRTRDVPASTTSPSSSEQWVLFGSRDLVASIDIVVDSLLVAVLFYTGFIPLFSRNPPTVLYLYMLQGIYGAFALSGATVLAVEKRCNSSPPAVAEKRNKQ